MNTATDTTISTWIIATALGERAGSAEYFGDETNGLKRYTKTERKQFRVQAQEAIACFATIVGWQDASNVEAWSTFEAARIAEINRLTDHNR
jgi:hypothetical protein